MPGIERRPGESLESMLRRFRRELSQSRMLAEYRRRQRFYSKSELRREKARRALRRAQRRQSRQQQRSRRKEV